MPQILGLPADTSPATGDKFLFQDGSSNVTKYMTYGTIKDSIAGAAWTSWTPTWTSLTISTSTVTARYVQIGKTVHYQLKVISAGSFAVTGDVAFTLPVTASSDIGGTDPIGNGQVLDNSSGSYYLLQVWIDGSGTTKGRLITWRSDVTFAQANGLTSTTPITWAVPDEIRIYGTYQAA